MGRDGEYVSDEMLESVAVAASQERLAPALLERYSGLLQRITLYRSYAPGTDDSHWQALITGLQATIPGAYHPERSKGSE